MKDVLLKTPSCGILFPPAEMQSLKPLEVCTRFGLPYNNIADYYMRDPDKLFYVASAYARKARHMYSKIRRYGQLGYFYTPNEYMWMTKINQYKTVAGVGGGVGVRVYAKPGTKNIVVAANVNSHQVAADMEKAKVWLDHFFSRLHKMGLVVYGGMNIEYTHGKTRIHNGEVSDTKNETVISILSIEIFLADVANNPVIDEIIKSIDAEALECVKKSAQDSKPVLEAEKVNTKEPMKMKIPDSFFASGLNKIQMKEKDLPIHVYLSKIVQKCDELQQLIIDAHNDGHDISLKNPIEVDITYRVPMPVTKINLTTALK